MFERIRDARKRAELSQEQFAAELGVSRGAVAQWEMREGTVPSVKNLERIAIATGVVFEWLATGRGEMVFGEPMLRETSAVYRDELTEDERALLDAFRAMEPAQRQGFMAFVSPPRKKR